MELWGKSPPQMRNVVGIEQQLFFFNSIPASIWQMFITESKEPLEIMDLDGSSSLYLCQSDPAGLHQESHTGWELNGSPHFQELLSEAWRTAISRGRLNRLSKHLWHLFALCYSVKKRVSARKLHWNQSHHRCTPHCSESWQRAVIKGIFYLTLTKRRLKSLQW